MTEPNVSTENCHRQECPRCGGETMRVRRLNEDRVAVVATPIRRYRCTSPGCGWEDAVALAPGTAPRLGLRTRLRARARQPRRLTASLSVAAGLVLAMVGAQAWQFYRHGPSAVDRVALGQQTLPFGESHDGNPLSPGHPLLLLESDGSTGGAPDAQSATPPAHALLAPAKPDADDESLQIRQDCAWGNPGRNPYRGTVEQALESARLPPEIAARLARMIHAGKATDRLEITTASIRTVHQYREYDPASIAMTFGKTLCVNTRVNFKPGHMERADLYEVADASGATYSVMVPYVCGNVSVLADRAERPDGEVYPPVMVLGPDGRPVVRKATAPLPGVITAGLGGPTGARTTLTAYAVPVPGTLANLLGGIALLGWFLRRRLRTRGGD